MVNYQSSRENWNRFWTDFSLLRVQTELKRAAQLGFNSIRIFVFTEEFGNAAVNPMMLQRLEQTIDAAAQVGLLTVVSFFPFKKEFRPERIPEMDRHITHIVQHFVGHPGIAMWDLMNEPDHTWGLKMGVEAEQVYAWAKHMLRAVKQADGSHLTTLGLAGHFATQETWTASQSIPEADIISVHGYFENTPLNIFLERAQSIGKPVVLQEVGKTGLYWTDLELAQFDKQACAQARSSGISGIGLWELFDHPVSSIDFYNEPWKENEENYFGLLRADGSVKHEKAQAWCGCLSQQSFQIEMQ
jgi:endo-1,4-beta-mannosidase